ncbi:MAG TPA: MBL fold metallo-hydrolase [Chloroflexota bacterium]|nr:MBL fold metallo-hydrolase [Chloroflexota bacterium]
MRRLEAAAQPDAGAGPHSSDDLTTFTTITAPNPGPKTLQGTNTYVVGEESLVVIDPGPAISSHVENIRQATQGREVLGVFVTHGHPDHAPAAVPLARDLRVPVFASKRLRIDFGDVVVRPLSAGLVFELGAQRLIAIESRGHSDDHFCFLLEPGSVLFSGDVILGAGTSLIALPEGDMSAYVETLERLRGLRPTIIAPGHGPLVDDPESKIQEYLSHRRERERALIVTLQSGSLTAADLVHRVYGVDSGPTFELAVLSVEAQLAKLVKEERVVVTGDRYSLRAAS